MTRMVLVMLLCSSPAFAKWRPEILCGVFNGKKVDFIVPNDEGRKLDRPIECALHVSLGLPFKQASVSISTWSNGPGPMHSGTVAVGDDFDVKLYPGAKFDGKVDFLPCQDDFEIVAEIAGDKGVLWSKRLKVHQKCSGVVQRARAAMRAPAPTDVSGAVLAPPAPPAPVAAPATFAAHILEELPDDGARQLAQRFADAAQNDDRAELAALCPPMGLRTPKKKLACDLLKKEGLRSTQFVPVCCNNEPACVWAPEWFGYSNKETEFQINNRSGCSGAATPVAVFKKRGAKWTWDEVRVDAADEGM